jgi:solute:Na+ symporter, SSS family
MLLSQYGFDLLVLALYFVVIIGIGLWCSRGEKTVEGFTLGHREVAWWAVLTSILASEISAATFLGAPGEGFSKRNWGYCQLILGTIIARIIVATVFIPAYYRMNVTSVYEFLELRFGRLSRHFGALTFMITRVLAMGTRLYVSAIILVLATEMTLGRSLDPKEKFLFYAGAVVLVTFLTALYTATGGIKAVIWTDFIQVGVLVASLGFSIYYLHGQLDNGWTSVTAHIKAPTVFNTLSHVEGTGNWWRSLLTEEYTIFTALIGSTFVTMATHGVDQDAVQRMLTAKNPRQSAFATIASGLVDLPVVGCFVLVGVMLSAYYAQGAPADLPKNDREVFPYFILHEMPAGLRGLVTAGLMATAMGSLSTALNALATSYANDFVFRRSPDMPEKAKLRTLRWTTSVFAFLIILVGVGTAALMATNPTIRIIPLVLGIMGYTFGSLLGVFLVAIFTKTRGNDFGNVLGMLGGFLAVLFFSVAEIQTLLGFTRTTPTGETAPFLILAFPWRITLGTLVTVAVALCFRSPSEKHDGLASPKPAQS